MEQVEIDGATVRIPDGIVAGPRRLWRTKPADAVVRLLRDGALAEADELLRKTVAGTGVSGDWWFLSAETARALDETDRAVVAYEAALEQRPDAPAFWWARLGSAALAAGKAPRAVEAYERAVQAGGESPMAWYRDLAKAYGACGRHDDAVTAFTKVVDGQKKPAERAVMELVRYLNRAGRKDEARQRLEHLLDQDPSTRPLDRVMAANNPEFFGMRRKVLHFVEDHLPGIRAGAQESLRGETDRRSTIWTYWAQGWDDLPEVVATCQRRLNDLAGPDVARLDADSAAELARIPADIDAIEMGHAARSDLLRLELLGRFGGTWIDATCFVTEDPRPHLATLGADGFFAFEKAGSTLATWLMVSEPDGYLVRMARSALHVYLREHKEWSYYFLLHYVFESLVLCDEEFRRLWTRSPRLKLVAPTAFMRHRTEPADQLDLESLFGESFVQKLSYRYIDDALKVPGSFMNHLLATY
jgi:tetratricopeptide (TPR) repeat protein